jgi:metal-responsive CopG/Arc/MetJ family transcriptional regulator
MKHHIGLTIDANLFREIEELRGREKRSPFIEHLIRLGLKTYRTENQLLQLKIEKFLISAIVFPFRSRTGVNFRF